MKTEDGFTNIEDIRVGDLVWSRDEATGEEGTRKVKQLFVTHPAKLVHLTYRLARSDCSGEDDDGSTGELTGTPIHPFWSIDREAWVEMSGLQTGERLLLAHGAGEATVISTTLENASQGERFTTYNFEVAEWHTYFVADEAVEDSNCAVWVHNAGLNPALCDDALAEVDSLVAGGMGRWQAKAQVLRRNHPNYVDHVPFFYKEKAFRRFVAKFDDEFARAGYTDVQGFMQGSSASGIKHKSKTPLDARAGIIPKDYDVALVSPQIVARGRELGIDVLKSGELKANELGFLGLLDVQNVLSAASKSGLRVNFRVYNSVNDVFANQHTIPFFDWK